MSMHEEVFNVVRKLIDEGDESRNRKFDLSPTLIAQRTFDHYQKRSVDPHTEWSAVEGYKAVARKVLAANFEAEEGDESVSYQADMFSGLLQERYPVPRRAGEEPLYRHIDALNLREIEWNIQTLRKSAEARLRHADALEAFAERKFKKAA